MKTNKNLNEDLLSGDKVSTDDLDNLFNCADSEEDMNAEIQDVVEETRNHIKKLVEIKTTTGNISKTKLGIEEREFLLYLYNYIQDCIDAGFGSIETECVTTVDYINNILIHDGKTPCLDISGLKNNEYITVYYDEDLDTNLISITKEGEVQAILGV